MTGRVTPTDDTPRERLARLGPEGVSDQELVALVLGHGTSGRPVHAISADVLRDIGGLHGLTRVSLGRLALVAGIGTAKACRLLAAVELGRRTLSVRPSPRLPLRTPEAAAEFLLPRYGAHPVERLGVVLLDSRHRLMGVHVVSEGALDAAIGIPRDVFHEAAIARAAAILLFHNHPSGDPAPSPDDLALTRRLRDAGRIVGIDLVDHLILADASYCSLRAAKLF